MMASDRNVYLRLTLVLVIVAFTRSAAIGGKERRWASFVLTEPGDEEPVAGRRKVHVRRELPAGARRLGAAEISSEGQVFIFDRRDNDNATGEGKILSAQTTKMAKLSKQDDRTPPTITVDPEGTGDVTISWANTTQDHPTPIMKHWSIQYCYSSAGDDYDTGTMTVAEAKQHCAVNETCKGFSFSNLTGTGHGDRYSTKIFFKTKLDLHSFWMSFLKEGSTGKETVGWSVRNGFILAGLDLAGSGAMTVAEAKKKCKELSDCEGFTLRSKDKEVGFKGPVADDYQTKIHLKSGRTLGSVWITYKKEFWSSKDTAPR
eukprot:gnl/TRDRNA2_/TRDRNA2_169274_c0_seq3.p1 gnl/TRDRNA2_/TRDRNA2_169274_c0~~gnl/TRDRNA2_/TRDRNA2_169274_c0_seq3.p1  ORF type:complete len:337 (+),score=37.38 gnl/TRDRNA2_/TRDRNA2_169274_c0_seq3:63-1013(+)